MRATPGEDLTEQASFFALAVALAVRPDKKMHNFINAFDFNAVFR